MLALHTQAAASGATRQRTQPVRLHRAGLSLIELLVVLGILAVLASLLLVASQQALATANRTKCASNLHQIGIAIQMYRDSFGGRFPEAARLPSHSPGLPSIADALGPYVESRNVFRCPSDPHYWQSEGLSYEYPGEFRGGRRLEDIQAESGRSSDRIWLLYDLDPFHGSPGSGRSRNFLYADGHVSQ